MFGCWGLLTNGLKKEALGGGYIDVTTFWSFPLKILVFMDFEITVLFFHDCQLLKFNLFPSFNFFSLSFFKRFLQFFHEYKKELKRKKKY